MVVNRGWQASVPGIRPPVFQVFAGPPQHDRGGSPADLRVGADREEGVAKRDTVVGPPVL